MRYYVYKHINCIEIRLELNKRCYSAFSPDDILLMEDVSLANVLIFATNNQKYKSLRSQRKVSKNQIKAQRLDKFNIKLTASLPNGKIVEVISKFPTVELAKRDFCYKINNGNYD